MTRALLITCMVLAVGARCIVPIQAQEATEPPVPPMPGWWIVELDGPWPPPWWNEAPPDLPAPTAEPLATPAPVLSDYAWCGYLLLEGVLVDADALALLATLFPTPDDGAPAQALMQWRAKPDGNGGILEGCHRLPVERWRLVSLLQQGTGMDYALMDESLVLTTFPDVHAVRTFLELYAAEWEAPVETPNPS